MLYCPHCGTVLLLDSSSSSGFYFSCKLCPYKHDMNKKVIARQMPRQKKTLDDIFGSEEARKAQSKTEVDCPKCHHNYAYYMQMQTRSADEPMTIFYSCEKCSHTWNEN
eukprot:m.258917 g.258917  ORF g.258917 m.258917 type:complete len:109 (+) comp15549_c0_seq1:119-445(+)